MTDDAMRKALVTMFEMIHGLAARSFRIAGGNIVSRLQTGRLRAWLRRFVGLSPALEDGMKRQRHGESLWSICRPVLRSSYGAFQEPRATSADRQRGPRPI